FFYELRPLFSVLADNTGVLMAMLKGGWQSVSPPPYTADLANIFNKKNSSARVTVHIKLDYGSFATEANLVEADPNLYQVPTELVLMIERDNGCTAKLNTPEAVDWSGDVEVDGVSLKPRGRAESIYIHHFIALFNNLRQSTYIGPFRNVLNLSGQSA